MAQIIFCPDAEEPLVHISDEVKIIAKVKLNYQEQQSLGSEVGADEIDKLPKMKQKNI